MKTHYETLGIGKDASQDEIKKAYRNMALKFHPDKNPGDANAEESFKNIALAYEVLKDEEKRRSYDIGFDPKTGLFDSSVIDPSLLDPDEFVSFFSGLFGEYLDEKIPGGFRGRVNEAANKAEKKKRNKRKRKPKCNKCKGSKRVVLQQGTFKIHVSCPSCNKSST